jgi:uncharacterized protein (TIGR02452 family)
MFTVVKLGEYTSASDFTCNYSPYSESSPSERSDNPFVRRINCWLDTLALCEQLPIKPPASVKAKSWDTHVMYDFIKNRERRKENEPAIEFLNKDAIDVALDLLATGKSQRPLVLNLADDSWPGGCVAQGSGAQEESLFRRSNYHQTLISDHTLYPIKDEEAVYSPEVIIVKSSEEDGWELYPVDQRPVLAFVACPGLRYPELVDDEDDEPRLKEEDVTRLKEKIGVILQIARQYKHDAIVLGALGCGAWRNPPKHVAEIFKSVLDTYEGMTPYRVIFAILSTPDDNNIVRQRMSGRKSTCDIFQHVFKSERN